MQGLDRFITGNWGEDQFQRTTAGEPGQCAWCEDRMPCRLILDPEPEVKGDDCWVCPDCEVGLEMCYPATD